MSVDSTVSTHSDRRAGQERRKQTSKSIREARQKLAYESGARPEFQYDLLYMFAKNELGASLAIPALAVIIAAATFYWAPTSSVIFWLSTIFVTKGILLTLCRKFLSEPRGEADVQKWRSWMTIAAFFSGMSWAALTLVTVPGTEQTADIVIFATLIVVICIRMMFASTVMPIIYASTVPMTTALVLHFVIANQAMYWVMAAMAICAHAYFVFLTKGLNNTVLSMLELRAEKDHLIAEIEESKSKSDDARIRAEDANLAKSQFLATMSHELRTPLNAILGFSEILSSELFGPHSNPTYKEYAKDIHESGEHLLKLINDILDLSRIEADRYELQEEAVPLDGVVDDCLRLLRLRAEKKGLLIKENIDNSLPKLWSEEKAIRQVCLNLLSNAIKFTPKGGTVTVEVGTDNEGAQYLTVQDTGPGIPEEEIPKVLSPFGQGSLAHEIVEGGTGLGLPIVKRLMDLHEGTFELKSQLRRGTRVTATFPSKRSMRALPPLSGSPIADQMQAEAVRSTATNTRSEPTTQPVEAKNHLEDRNKEHQRLEQLAYGKKSSRAAKLLSDTTLDLQPQDASKQHKTGTQGEEERRKLRELAQNLREERMSEPQEGDNSPHDAELPTGNAISKG